MGSNLILQSNKEVMNRFAELRVYVVEPALSFRSSMKLFLHNLYIKRIEVMASGEELERAILRAKPDLIICAWDLPDNNGIMLRRDLNKNPKNRDIRFILTGSENLRDDVVLASEVGIDGYLLRPFSFDSFVKKFYKVFPIKEDAEELNQVLRAAEGELEREDFDEASRLFNDALSVNPASARALCGLAELSWARGSGEEALLHLEEASRANPDFLKTYRLILKIHVHNKNLDGILEAVRTLHQMSPANPRYALILAQAFLDKKDLNQAEFYFDLATKLSPLLARSFQGLGKVSMARNEIDQAQRYYQKALDLEPDDASTLNSFGLSFAKLGLYLKAIEKYALALKLRPGDAAILFNIAKAKEMLRDFIDAENYYEAALNRSPDFAKAARGLARVRTLTGPRLRSKKGNEKSRGL